MVNRLFGVLISGLCTLCVTTLLGTLAQDLSGEAWQLETKGEAVEAQVRLQKAVERSPNDAAAVRAYAEFLDRHRDPSARAVYAKLTQVLERAKAPRDQVAAVARREAILDLIAGDTAAASKHLDAYRAAGGAGLAMPDAVATAPVVSNFIEIPGPLRSFARMAALAPDLKPEDLLVALARNVVTNGYQAGRTNEALEQTEYLKLVVRYLSQARELTKLSGESQIIKIRNLRFHRDRRSAAGARVSYARRLRVGSGAGDSQRVAGISHHRFGIPAGRARTVAANQPNVRSGLSSGADSGAL